MVLDQLQHFTQEFDDTTPIVYLLKSLDQDVDTCLKIDFVFIFRRHVSAKILNDKSNLIQKINTTNFNSLILR